MRDVEISVIIPARNEEKYIHYPREGLANQTYKNFETIVVDSKSSDGTRGRAKKFARVIEEPRRGVSRARNAGAAASHGEILLFIDADTKPTRDLLWAYHNVFKDDRIVAATGPIYPIEKTKRRIKWGYKFVSVVFVKAGIFVRKPPLVGSNLAVRRSAFEKVHGFKESLKSHEDWDISYRLAKLGKIAYVDQAVVHTSARRIEDWGVFKFFSYKVKDMAMYQFSGKAQDDYHTR